jgi:hypothetical protein
VAVEAVEEWATARRQKPRRGRGVVLEEVHKEIGVLGAAAARGVQMVPADVGARLGPVVRPGRPISIGPEIRASG